MDLFMFDIETTGQYKDFYEFEQQDEKGANLFRAKYNKMGWNEKYENINEAYLDNAGIISTYGRIVCISFGYLDKGQQRILSFYGDDEKDIVESFNNQVGNRGFNSMRAAHDRAQWKFSGDKHKSLQVDTERTFHQRYPLAML